MGPILAKRHVTSKQFRSFQIKSGVGYVAIGRKIKIKIGYRLGYCVLNIKNKGQVTAIGLG